MSRTATCRKKSDSILSIFLYFTFSAGGICTLVTRFRRCAFLQFAHWMRLRGGRLLDKTVKEHPSVDGMASIEAKGELLQIMGQLLSGRPPLKNSQQLALQKSGNTVHAWQDRSVFRIFTRSDMGLMDVSEVGQMSIGEPAVRDYSRSRCDDLPSQIESGAHGNDALSPEGATAPSLHHGPRRQLRSSTWPRVSSQGPFRAKVPCICRRCRVRRPQPFQPAALGSV